MLYYTPHICTKWPLYDYIGTIFSNKIRGRPGPTHPPPSKVTLDLRGELALLVIKIIFFLDFSCFCTFNAENHPGTTQKKWQQGLSCLVM